MTIAVGIGRTLPSLVPDLVTASLLRGGAVPDGPATIARVQWRFADTPPVSAAARAMPGGALVLATGVLIGNPQACQAPGA